MKVIAINGSPNRSGGTYHSLKAVCNALERNGATTEILHVGDQTFHGCKACGGCSKNKNRQCVLGDGFNGLASKIFEADGIIIGSPVHFSGMSGVLKTFLDRLFYVSTANGNLFYQKVGAAIASVRRSGGVATVDGLNHYLQYSGMLMPASNYWNVVHGNGGDQVLRDEEGMQTMDLLGENMAWMLRLRQIGQNANPPAAPKKVYMSFIRD
ncbi:MAG: flavodoxin family protein [Defluviitaleaceae bacterium]|nr:flavodoxin family protein [Defluviitaleaceae bacterium]